MADPTKSEEKKDYFPEVLVFLLVLFLVSMALERIVFYLQYSKYGAPETIAGNVGGFFSGVLWPIWKLLATFIILGVVIGIMRIYQRIKALNLEEKEIYGPAAHVPLNGAELLPKNEKWERIVEHVNSPNASDWRLAIIEGDVMLEDLLRQKGYHGDTIGEMLKGAEKGDFLTLENAWRAHKIRNDIAHRGSDFPLNEREAKEAVALFESVFKEFKII